jgi:undecaprenyl-diphosphatase
LKDWDVPVAVGQIVEMKGYEMLLQKNYLILFIIGNIVAFAVAVLAIKFFIGILKKYGFKMWGWYRIVLGITFIIFEVFFNK